MTAIAEVPRGNNGREKSRAAAPAAPTRTFEQIRVDQVDVGDNVRIQPGELDELAASIAELGVLQCRPAREDVTTIAVHYQHPGKEVHSDCPGCNPSSFPIESTADAETVAKALLAQGGEELYLTTFPPPDPPTHDERLLVFERLNQAQALIRQAEDELASTDHRGVGTYLHDLAAQVYDVGLRLNAGEPIIGICRECGCTGDFACDVGCAWADDSQTLCDSHASVPLA